MPTICKGFYTYNLERIKEEKLKRPNNALEQGQWNYLENIVYKEMKMNEDFCPKPTVSNFLKKEYFEDKIDEFKKICLRKFAR